MKRLSTTLSVLSLLVLSVSAQSLTRQVLFIGNSYTYSNNLPDLVSQIALSLGDSLIHASSTPGGYTFLAHSTNTATLGAIAQGSWDMVVLQEQSQRPSFPPSQVAMDVYPYASLLVDSVLSASPCAEPVFFMTWGRENGDQQNCVSYPPLCTYGGMQQRLRESYLQMAQDNSAWCAPVGAAWSVARDLYPAVPLYVSDGSHPNANGSYLAASVMYCTFFGKACDNSTFNHTLDPSTAQMLRQLASTMVLDSSTTWNIEVNDPDAGFTTSAQTNTVDFMPNTSNGSHVWDLGDGQNSTATAPTHTYAQQGTFQVIHTVTDGCGRVSQDTVGVVVIPSAVTDVGPANEPTVDLIGDQLIIGFGRPTAGYVELFDALGRSILQDELRGLRQIIQVPDNAHGNLHYRITTGTNERSGTIQRH